MPEQRAYHHWIPNEKPYRDVCKCLPEIWQKGLEIWERTTNTKFTHTKIKNWTTLENKSYFIEKWSMSFEQKIKHILHILCVHTYQLRPPACFILMWEGGEHNKKKRNKTKNEAVANKKVFICLQGQNSLIYWNNSHNQNKYHINIQ